MLAWREWNKQGQEWEKVKLLRQARGQTIKVLTAGIENLNFTLWHGKAQKEFEQRNGVISFT